MICCWKIFKGTDMDFSVKNYNVQSPVFGAKLGWRTRKAIKNGIKSKYKKLNAINPEYAKSQLVQYNELFNKIKFMVSNLESGTFALYNQLGLSPKATKISFSNKSIYRAFDLPKEIQNEIKVVDKSNIFVEKYVIKEFPANKLNWLYNFLENIKIY